MNSSKKYNAVLMVAAIVSITCTIIYVFLLRHYTVLAFENLAPKWFQTSIDYLYPRFSIEKQRFDLDFFLKKTDQIIVRLNLVLLVTALYFFLKKYRAVRASIKHFWDLRIQPMQQKWLIILFYSGVIFYGHDWHIDLKHYHLLKDFYQPILLFKILQIKFIDYNLMALAVLIMFFSALMVILNMKPLTNSVICAIAFIMLQGYFHSFEKVDHNFVTLSIAAMLMPLFIMERKSYFNWPLRLIQVSLAATYFFSGLEKLLSSGFSWLEGNTFKTYLYIHQAPLGLAAMESPFLTFLLPLAALIFQLFFPFIFIFYRYRVFFVLSAVLFHVGTVILFNIGDFLNPWMFTLIFFLPAADNKRSLGLQYTGHNFQKTKALF